MPHDDQAPSRWIARFVTVGSTAVLIANGVGFVIYMGLRYTIGAEWRIVLWLHNVVACWGLAGVAACGVALLFKRRWRLVALQLPLIGTFMFWYGPQFVPQRGVAVPGGAELRVATYNVGTYMSDPVQVMQVIEALDADVVGLQDMGTGDALIPLLESAYPYTLLPFAHHQIGLVSRYPITEQYLYQKRYLRAVLDVNGQAITVFVFTTLAPEYIWSPWRYEPVRHPPELAQVLEALSDETNPVIVLCDCNASDQSDLYEALDARLDDAFREVGWGLGLTFPAHITPQIPLGFPLVRLDYIWYGSGMEAYDAAVWSDSGGSDHRPVVATLGLPR